MVGLAWHRLALAWIGSALALIAANGAVAEPRTTNDGIYTQAQAKAGERLHRQHCVACHDKQYFRPVLQAWDGQTLADLYAVMSATMPESSPGVLSDEEYVDILAYILSLNRYPAGDIGLEYRDGLLDEITIAGPQTD